MTTHRLIDDQPTLDRLSKLLTYWQRKAYECEMHAAQAHSDGNAHGCAYFRAHMIDAEARASIVAGRMVAESAAPGLADVLAKLPDDKIAQIAPPDDEPPSTLVGLTDWLRGKIERWFPLMPSELWQGIAFVLLHHRRQP